MPGLGVRDRLTGCSPSLGSHANSDECCDAKSEMDSVNVGRLQKSSIFSSRPRGASAAAACVYGASEPDGGATAIGKLVRSAQAVRREGCYGFL